MPSVRAPAMSRDSESPTNVASAGPSPSASSAWRKIRGSGFAQPTCAESTRDRKSTRLNSSHDQISYAVFCLKKKKKYRDDERRHSEFRLTTPEHTHTPHKKTDYLLPHLHVPCYSHCLLDIGDVTSNTAV